MARLVVIADPETAPGYELAGVEVICAEDAETARTRLLELLADASVGLVAVSAALLDALDEATRARAESGYKPVVVSLPTGGPVLSFVDRREYLAAIVSRAIGFHITFPGSGETQPGGTPAASG